MWVWYFYLIIYCFSFNILIYFYYIHLIFIFIFPLVLFIYLFYRILHEINVLNSINRCLDFLCTYNWHIFYILFFLMAWFLILFIYLYFFFNFILTWLAFGGTVIDLPSTRNWEENPHIPFKLHKAAIERKICTATFHENLHNTHQG